MVWIKTREGNLVRWKKYSSLAKAKRELRTWNNFYSTKVILLKVSKKKPSNIVQTTTKRFYRESKSKVKKIHRRKRRSHSVGLNWNF